MIKTPVSRVVEEQNERSFFHEFGERIKFRRGELKLSRGELAGRLGVSPSAVSNYENGLSFPKEDVMLRLFDSLETDPINCFGTASGEADRR